MPIPIPPLGQEYAYDFQFAILVKEPASVRVLLDQYFYEPVHAPIAAEEQICLSAEDLRRIYAPYLQFSEENGTVLASMSHPLREKKHVTLECGDWIVRDGVLYIKAAQVMSRCFDRQVKEVGPAIIVAVDGETPIADTYPSMMSLLPMLNRLHGANYGEQFFTFWMEEAERLIPYRMYIPFSYVPGVPHKTVVCFHGGDANADYMFKHTDHNIDLYAEDQSYILLALCSYRKYTFFGASKCPAVMDKPVPGDSNPCGLTEDQLKWDAIAEKSVLLQIEDAKKRYALDEKQMYALGNSGGCLGIFRQTAILPDRYFRAVSCSGSLPNVLALDTELLRQRGTQFLILMASEDVFDGQYSFRVGYPYLKEHGVPVEFHAVGGGSHLTGWTKALDYIFDFFRRH